MKVHEVMTKNPAFCCPSTSVVRAAATMQQLDIGALPVVLDPSTPRLLGMVTDRDLCLHVVAGGRDPADIWISECMTVNPICCAVGDDVRYALELMEEHQVRRLPVVNAKHEVAGILSLSDLVGKGSINSGEIAEALRTICEPVRETTEPMEMITAA
ncbi:MAG: CBS domain-containing protein [Terriglobales bacterium]